MSRRTVQGLALAAALGVLSPRVAHANSGDFTAAYVGIGAAGLVALGMNILPIVAETQIRPNGRMPNGWLATQYVAGGLDLAAGVTVLATTNSELGVAVGFIPLAVGGLWTTLAIIHDVRNSDLPRWSRARPEAPPLLGGLRPFVAPTRRDEGLVAGFSLRF